MKRIAVTLLLIASLGSQAQEAKVSKERAALRRAQTALRAAQEEQSAIQADKAKSEAELATAKKEAAAARARIAGNADRLKARDAELAALRKELQGARQSQRDDGSKSAEREQALLQQVTDLRRENAARLQTTQALTALLERSTTALAEAEQRNTALQALGEDLVRRYTARPVVDTALLDDPLLGLTAVRYEDRAEQMRKELEALRVKR